jgi:hypothetical protein
MVSTHPVAAVEDRTVYPVEERVGEDIIQRWIIEVLRPLMARWFAKRGQEAFVGADQFIYYEQHNAHKRMAPDVYVMPGVAPNTEVSSFKLWEWRRAPSLAVEVASQDWEKDYYEGPGKYEELGVEELVIFDPHREQREERVLLQRYARRDGEWQCVERTNGDRVRSEVLGAWLRSVESEGHLLLRIGTDPKGDELFPTGEEEERRGKEEERRAKEEERRAKEEERRAKEEALERIRELEEELTRRG